MEKSFSPEKVEKHAEMLAARCLKNFKKLKSRFDKTGAESFRIYHWDIPEVRCVVDWYKGHLVLGEYTREQTEGLDYLEKMAEYLQKSFQIPMENIHLKKRRTRQDGSARYGRLDRKDEFLEIREGNNKFLVNLDDFLDTGLFNDQRITRSMIEKQCTGKKFLNLYCYTGTFTVSAARGGASLTTSVDLSPRYLDWLQKNLEINQLSSSHHEFFQDESSSFIAKAIQRKSKWDIIWLDPPSFSTAKDGSEILDIQNDHNRLIKECLQLLSPQGILYFSTNHQRFKENFSGLDHITIKNLTDDTIPEDYSRYKPHLLWSFQA